MIKEMFNKVRNTADAFWNGKSFMPIVFLVSFAALVLNIEMAGMFILAGLCVFLLLFCDDMLSIVCPALCIMLLSTEYYVDYTDLLPYVPYAAVPFAASFVFNVIYYRRPFAKGKLTYPLIAVSLALLLGGVGVISKEEYFLPSSLYFMLCLGPAMLLLYFLTMSRLKNERSYVRSERLAQILYTSGLVAACVIFVFYAENAAKFVEEKHVLFYKPRNYVSSVLLMTLPACCIMFEKRRIHLLGFIAMCLALVFTGSRSGLLFGIIIGFVCFVYSCILHREKLKNDKRFRKLLIVAFVIAAAVAIWIIPELYANRLTGGKFISKTETRVSFISLGIQDFLGNPINGVGVGYQGNRSIFKAIIPGSIVYYHNIVIQVIASMGIIGAIAYLWVFAARVKYLITNLRNELIVFGFSYAGILAMSLTNPGVFCPFPEAALVTLIFAVIESETVRRSLPSLQTETV